MATVAIWWLFDPASGSVMAKAILVRPVARSGSQRSRCSSEPNRAITVPQMADDTSRISSGHPAAEHSSSTMASSAIPMPPPSCSAGMLTPTNPCAASSSHRSWTLSPAFDCSTKYSGP